MTFLPKVSGLGAAALLLATSLPLLADAPQAKTEGKKAQKKLERKADTPAYIRVTRDEKKQPSALQTATVRYVPASGNKDVFVDLIGVVHIGEKGYYEKLNDQFEQYDVLLYELVAPQGTRVPKGGGPRGNNPVSLLQHIMKVVLDLESQVEHIDYQKKNFVHADLSPDEMMKLIRERGDDPLSLFLSIMADMMRQQNLEARKAAEKGDEGEPEPDFLSLFTDPHAATKLKRMMAAEFENNDDLTGSLGGTLNTILVTDRNKAAMRVLEEQLAKGKKKIGIFYGAAHMPDFDARLRSEFGLKPGREEWLTAWNLRMEGKGKGGLLDLFKPRPPVKAKDRK
jgi:hypothetical protein